METINALIGVLLLLSAIAGAWLTRQNKRQQAEIERLNGEVFDADSARDRMEQLTKKQLDAEYWKGWYKCEAKWKNEPLYKKGYDAALVEQAGVACEMELLRTSGELDQAVKELS